MDEWVPRNVERNDERGVATASPEFTRNAGSQMTDGGSTLVIDPRRTSGASSSRRPPLVRSRTPRVHLADLGNIAAEFAGLASGLGMSASLSTSLSLSVPRSEERRV